MPYLCEIYIEFILTFVNRNLALFLFKLLIEILDGYIINRTVKIPSEQYDCSPFITGSGRISCLIISDLLTDDSSKMQIQLSSCGSLIRNCDALSLYRTILFLGSA